MYRHFARRVGSIAVYTIAILFVIVLWQTGYIVVPSIFHIQSLLISFVLVGLGFLILAASWWRILSVTYSQSCGYVDALISLGITIFGKYIPGKIWTVAGRAYYISRLNNLSLAKTGLASADLQLLAIWSGCLLGGLAFVLIDTFSNYFILFAVALFLLTLFLLIPNRWAMAEKLIHRISGKDKEGTSSAIDFVTYILVVVNWFVWCVGFYFLIISFTNANVPFYMGLIFALAAVLSFLAPFAPGGVGVREGLLAGLLISAGMDAAQSATIALASRLWFLAGEFFVFLMALIFRRNRVAAGFGET